MVVITARVMRRSCLRRRKAFLAILLGIGVAGILRHRSAGQARAGENGKETTEAPESAAAEDAVRIRLAESEKQSRRLLAGLRKHSRRRKRDDAIWRNSWKYAAERAHGRELQLELDAVEMAKNEIIRLSREYGDERRDEINSVVSRYVSAITEGKYDLAEVDETGKLRVQTEGREVLPEALSREERWNSSIFAFRMAVGSIVTQEEPRRRFWMKPLQCMTMTVCGRRLRLGGKRIADDPVYLPETGNRSC